uniref:GOLD domain-containing protein n=1 Tax=Eptatretus burgeri TaxID=7764 RepID=A0A8C4QPE0_EPTBU
MIPVRLKTQYAQKGKTSFWSKTWTTIYFYLFVALKNVTIRRGNVTNYCLHKQMSKKEEKQKSCIFPIVLQERMSTLELRMFVVGRFYNFARIQGRRDFFLLSSNFNYITCWSIAQSVLITMVGIIQVFTLRHLFRAKTLTPSLRPRC